MGLFKQVYQIWGSGRTWDCCGGYPRWLFYRFLTWTSRILLHRIVRHYTTRKSLCASWRPIICILALKAAFRTSRLICLIESRLFFLMYSEISGLTTVGPPTIYCWVFWKRAAAACVFSQAEPPLPVSSCPSVYTRNQRTCGVFSLLSPRCGCVIFFSFLLSYMFYVLTNWHVANEKSAQRNEPPTQQQQSAMPDEAMGIRKPGSFLWRAPWGQC